MWQDALLFVLYLNTNVLLQPQSEATLSSGEVGVVPKEMSSSYPASFWTLFFLCWTSKNSRHAVRAQLLQSFPTLGNCMDCSLPGSSIHGICQARMLEWVAMSCSRQSSWPRDQTHVSCITGRFFTTEPPGKPPRHVEDISQDDHSLIISLLGFLLLFTFCYIPEPSEKVQQKI